MSRVIYLVEQRFSISRCKFPDILIAVSALNGKETVHGPRGGSHFMWLPNVEFSNFKSIEEVFELWRWPVELNDEGDIDEIMFTGEKWGDEDLFFGAIAPYVDSGSYIQMFDGEGHVWRWFFDGSCCVRKHGRIVFD